MDLVNEEDLPVAEIGQDGSQVTFNLQGRAGGLLEGCSQLVRNNAGQRSLAESRWPVEQHMIECLAAGLSRLNGDVKILFDFVLPDELLQPLRSKLELK